MFAHIFGRLIAFISSWKYLALILVLYLLTQPLSLGRSILLVILSVASLFWALLIFRRIRLIEDTADTLLSTAAQGYVELMGNVSLYDGEEVVRMASDTMPPVVWYRKSFWNTDSSGFLLEDAKGRCTIDPRDAEVITPLHNFGTNYFRAIYPGESIYVLGQLETLKKHRTEYERNAAIAQKVLDWKRDPRQFLDYFDRNRDGKIDKSELDIARNSATRMVDDDLEEEYQNPATHVVSKPEDGRPFILSSIPPEKLIRDYTRALIVHLLIWLYFSVLVLVQ